MTVALGPGMVMCHLKPSPTETTLDIEPFIGFAAIENRLVAPDARSDIVEGLDEAETEFLSLLVLGDGNVFNVASFSEAVDTMGNDINQLATCFERVVT